MTYINNNETYIGGQLVLKALYDFIDTAIRRWVSDIQKPGGDDIRAAQAPQ